MTQKLPDKMTQAMNRLEANQDVASVETWHHVRYGDVIEIEFNTEPQDAEVNRVDRSTLDAVGQSGSLHGYTLRTFGVSLEGRPVGCYIPEQ